MKNLKPIFEFFEKLLVCGVQRHIASGNKIFPIKAATFALILIPCLLQFPLIALGQDGTDGINGCLVPFKCDRESVHSVKAIVDGGYFRGEGRFIFLDSGPENRPSFSGNGESMTDSLNNPVSNNTENKSCKQSIHPCFSSSERINDHPECLHFFFIVVSIFSLLNGFGLTAIICRREGQQYCYDKIT